MVKTRGAELTVQADISSPNSDLEEVKLLLNGKSVAAEFQVGTGSLTFERTVPLVVGENRLAIYCRNSASGHTSEERIVVYEPGGTTATGEKQAGQAAEANLPDALKPNLYVLSVGVSDYENADIALDFCDDDASAVARIFENQEGTLFKNVEVRLLVNSDASRGAVLDGLEWLEESATQKDFVVLFLAAHGANDRRGKYYMLPTGGDFEKLRSTGVAWDDFADVLGNLPSRTLMFLDTCHSGQLGKKSLHLCQARRDGEHRRCQRSDSRTDQR